MILSYSLPTTSHRGLDSWKIVPEPRRQRCELDSCLVTVEVTLNGQDYLPPQTPHISSYAYYPVDAAPNPNPNPHPNPNPTPNRNPNLNPNPKPDPDPDPDPDPNPNPNPNPKPSLTLTLTLTLTRPPTRRWRPAPPRGMASTL